MPPWLARVRAAVWPPALRDRRNIRALASHLGIDDADAAWLYSRSREVGYPSALADYREWCRERSQESLTGSGPARLHTPH